MRGHRLTWPYRTYLTRSLVADRKDEVEHRSVGLSEFVPILTSIVLRRYAQNLKRPQRKGMNFSCRMATR